MCTISHACTHRAVGQHGLVAPGDCVGLQRATWDKKLPQSVSLVKLDRQVPEEWL